MRAIFSETQQRVMLSMRGSTRKEAVESFDAPTRYVDAPYKALAAHVYEGATPDEIVVATSKYNETSEFNFDDAVDMGPVGEHLHAFKASGHYPTRPMILDRSRLADLVAGRLTPAEVEEAVERAMVRSESPGAPTP